MNSPTEQDREFFNSAEKLWTIFSFMSVQALPANIDENLLKSYVRKLQNRLQADSARDAVISTSETSTRYH